MYRKKTYYISLLFILLVFLLTGCGTIVEKSENLSNSEAIEVDTADTVDNKLPSEVLLTTNKYYIVNTPTGYSVYSTDGNTLIGLYTDYCALQYFNDESDIKTNHILVEKTENDKFRFLYLNEEGLIPYNHEYKSYAFYSDYLIADGILHDGNLIPIGFAYGDVTSVSSLEEGANISFSENEGVIHSYFHMTQVEEPKGVSTFAYMEESYIHGANNMNTFLAIDNKEYLKLGNDYFQLPHQETVNLESYIRTEDGTVVFLFFENTDMSDRMACKISLAYGKQGSVYCHVVKAPIDSFHGAAFGQYDQYLCSYIPEVQWYVGANGMFHSFLGGLNIVCDENYLLHAINGVTTVEKYHLYDQNLKIAAVFDDAAILQNGSIIGKTEEEEVVLYGKDGSVVSKASYEKVITLGSYGAAIAENGQVRFIDVNGNLLVSVDGYRNSFQFDRQSSGYRQTDDKYYVTFLDMENPTDLVSFWYDPQTKEAGIE